ncbi:MAG: lipoate--protein ligase family protein [Candidatus Marinimicrobia bacterium]|nr:lipoate--protein ligase family protein [Candidatus Neomarinimicrobiota bacterium]
MTVESDPVVLISSSNRSYVALPTDPGTAQGVNRQYCERYKIDIVPRQIGTRTEFVDSQYLNYHIIMPQSEHVTQRISLTAAGWRSELAAPVIAAYHGLGVTVAYSEPDQISVADKKIGILTVELLDHAVVLSGALTADVDLQSAAGALSSCGEAQQAKVLQSLTAHTTTLSKESGQAPSPEMMATKLIDALESHWQYELYPSFPTPDELELVEQYDEILRPGADAIDSGETATVVVPISATASVVWSAAEFDQGHVEAVVSIAGDTIEAVVLSGNIMEWPAAAVSDLATRMAAHGISADLLGKKFEALRRAEQMDLSSVSPPSLGADNQIPSRRE